MDRLPHEIYERACLFVDGHAVGALDHEHSSALSLRFGVNPSEFQQFALQVIFHDKDLDLHWPTTPDGPSKLLTLHAGHSRYVPRWASN